MFLILKKMGGILNVVDVVTFFLNNNTIKNS